MAATWDEVMSYEHEFLKAYKNPARPILYNSPELLFLEHLCRGHIDAAVALFDEEQQFHRGPSVVDAPQGRYEGLQEIRRYAEQWLSWFNATESWIEPVHQTRAGGRSATELVVYYRVRGFSKVLNFPMCIVAELRGLDRLNEARVYFFFRWMPGLHAHRRRVFPVEREAPPQQNMMSSLLRDYFYQGDRLFMEGSYERMCELVGRDAIFGGFRPTNLEPVYYGTEAYHEKLKEFIPRGPRRELPEGMEVPAGIRTEVITDDGLTIVCEWEGFVCAPGAPRRVGIRQSGCSIYVREPETGLLQHVRIIDNAGFEAEIDWSQVDERDW